MEVAASGDVAHGLLPVFASEHIKELAGQNPDFALRAEGRAQVNGAPGVLLTVGGVLDSVVTYVVRDGLVQEIYFVRNPDKLGHLAEPRGLTRR